MEKIDPNRLYAELSMCIINEAANEISDSMDESSDKDYKITCPKCGNIKRITEQQKSKYEHIGCGSCRNRLNTSEAVEINTKKLYRTKAIVESGGSRAGARLSKLPCTDGGKLTY